MKTILKYSRYGVEINVSPDASKEDKMRAYLEALGGPQGLLNHFFRYASIVEYDIEETKTVE